MSWIDKILPTGIGKSAGERVNVPEGLWHKCVKCEAILYRPDLENNQYVCPKCDHHMRIRARERLSNFMLLLPLSLSSVCKILSSIAKAALTIFKAS